MSPKRKNTTIASQEVHNVSIEFDSLGSDPTIADLPDAISELDKFQDMQEIGIPEPQKDAVETHELQHRHFEQESFWTDIPAFAKVSEDEFRDLARRANIIGLGIVVDFVANHLAIDSLLLRQHPEYFIHRDEKARFQIPIERERRKVFEYFFCAQGKF